MSCSYGKNSSKTIYVTMGRPWVLCETGFKGVSDFEFVYYVGDSSYVAKREGWSASGCEADSDGNVTVHFSGKEFKEPGYLKCRRTFVCEGNKTLSKETYPVYIDTRPGGTEHVLNRINLTKKAQSGEICTEIVLQSDRTTSDIAVPNGRFTILERGFDGEADFEFEYYVGDSTFTASNKDGVYTNCRLKEDGSVLVDFYDHPFKEVGHLSCRRTLHFDEDPVSMDDNMTVVVMPSGGLRDIKHNIVFKGSGKCPCLAAEEAARKAMDIRLRKEMGSMFRVVVFSEDPLVFMNNKGFAKLKAHVYKGNSELIDLPTHIFNWERKSGDEEADEIWNNRHKGAGSIIKVTAEEVTNSALFDCNVTIPDYLEKQYKDL